MKGTSRCSDYGRPENETEDGRPYWPPTLRESLSWGSPERRLERLIVRRFLRSGGAPQVTLGDTELRRALSPYNPGWLFSKPGFFPDVKRLVAESMYRIDIKVSGQCLEVSAI